MATTGVKLIDLVPAKELAFEYASATTCERKLVITNTHDTDIAFKVKTTAPKAYLVKPSNDLLEKGKSVEIQILLEPGHAPGQGGNTPHRFLVQAALPATPGSNLSKTEWAALRKVGWRVQREDLMIFRRKTQKKKHLGLAWRTTSI